MSPRSVESFRGGGEKRKREEERRLRLDNKLKGVAVLLEKRVKWGVDTEQFQKPSLVQRQALKVLNRGGVKVFGLGSIISHLNFSFILGFAEFRQISRAILQWVEVCCLWIELQ